MHHIKQTYRIDPLQPTYSRHITGRRQNNKGIPIHTRGQSIHPEMDDDEPLKKAAWDTVIIIVVVVILVIVAFYLLGNMCKDKDASGLLCSLSKATESVANLLGDTADWVNDNLIGAVLIGFAGIFSFFGLKRFSQGGRGKEGKTLPDGEKRGHGGEHDRPNEKNPKKDKKKKNEDNKKDNKKDHKNEHKKDHKKKPVAP